MIGSGSEASIALPASQVMAKNRIEVLFASWLVDSCHYLYDRGATNVYYIPRMLPPAPQLSLEELSELDRRYSPPGLPNLIYAEMRARHRQDTKGLP